MAKQIQKFRSDVRDELSNIVDNAQNVGEHIRAYHPKTTRPIAIPLGNRIGGDVFYSPRTGGFEAHFRDENGVLYEISVFKR